MRAIRQMLRVPKGPRTFTRSGAWFGLLMVLVPAAAAMLMGCGGEAAPSGGGPAPAGSVTTDLGEQAAQGPPTLSDRDGPSWHGRLGDSVRIDWYDQTSGTTTSELVTILSVTLVATSDDAGPRGSGSTESAQNASGYDWRYAIKVRLESLDQRAARRPIAYQFLMLSDGEVTQTGIGGLGSKGGPNPSAPGRSSTGILYQWAEEGFRPTEVILPVGAWQASWSLAD